MRAPERPGGAGEELSRCLAGVLEAVAPLGQGLPEGDEPLQLDRQDLAAVLLALVALGAQAEGTVYRCPGPPVLYTEQLSPREAQDRGCRTIESAPVTVMQTKPRPVPVPAGATPGASAQRSGEGRVDPAEQRARDADARRILEAEVVRGDHAGLSKLLLNGLGLGIDAQVTHAYLRAPRGWPGFWRYAWGAVTSLGDLRLAGLRLTVDGQTLYQGPSVLAAVMNSTRYGGGFHISPQSDARDGLLNAVCSGPLSRLQLADLMLRVLPGKHLGHPLVHHTQGRDIELLWDTPMFLHLDGDLYGQARHLRARVLPGAVTLLNG